MSARKKSVAAPATEAITLAANLEVILVDGFTSADDARCNTIAPGDTAAINPLVAAAVTT